ncbi:conserved unknown protein [Ectocarpus siliculosus]|uniref:Uncharacterized protein n=1 Tax=Ectocarpus siliculosus TaxID=2880 RepID=D8LBG4_ECTSI|nr:conserved unknown protein [Ectocarpus siliculosus]|eukprot:CBN76673.1 conserved unknown protein [Ectocarpus siliculosus]
MDRGRRAMPVQNKACYERHVKKCQDNHRDRLAKMKPTIDCHAPSSMRKVATKTNAKKQQIMEDRYAQIERDNRLLLEKMSHIMRKGGVDNHNSTSKYSKSLNKGARKKELHKITTENQRILHAIQQADPFYDHIKWAEEAQQNEKYMRNICTMPVRLREEDTDDEGMYAGEG